METKHYFEVTHGKTHKVFGPYPTLAEARKASFFYNDANAYWRAHRDHRTGRTAFMTCGYEDAELAGFAADPEAFGYKRTIVKAKAPMHASWKTENFTADFRATYFADCYKSTFGEVYE